MNIGAGISNPFSLVLYLVCKLSLRTLCCCMAGFVGNKLVPFHTSLTEITPQLPFMTNLSILKKNDNTHITAWKNTWTQRTENKRSTARASSWMHLTALFTALFYLILIWWADILSWRRQTLFTRGIAEQKDQVLLIDHESEKAN